MGTIEVHSVQIGPMALSVPPGPLKRLSSAGQVNAIIILLIFCRKLHIGEMKKSSFKLVVNMYRIFSIKNYATQLYGVMWINFHKDRRDKHPSRQTDSQSEILHPIYLKLIITSLVGQLIASLTSAYIVTDSLFRSFYISAFNRSLNLVITTVKSSNNGMVFFPLRYLEI